MVFTSKIFLKQALNCLQVDVQSIRIDRANGLDYGDYTCVARNSLGSVNLTRTLTIIEKANVSYHSNLAFYNVVIAT